MLSQVRLGCWNVGIESQTLQRLHDVLSADGARAGGRAPLLGRHRHEVDELRGALLHALPGTDGYLETAFLFERKTI